MGAVDSRGSTTPPALNIANYPTTRALSYADNIVYRPPACFLVACFWADCIDFFAKVGIEIGFCSAI